MILKEYQSKVIMMKKLIFILVCLTFSFSKLYSQKIYSVSNDYQADVKVFVTDHDYQADLLVYKVSYDYQAKDNTGLWYFTDYDYQAAKKIYFTKYDYQADLKIYFVNYDYQAKWRNTEKKHLLL
jgi:hypothetical protein